MHSYRNMDAAETSTTERPNANACYDWTMHLSQQSSDTSTRPVMAWYGMINLILHWDVKSAHMWRRSDPPSLKCIWLLCCTWSRQAQMLTPIKQDLIILVAAGGGNVVKRHGAACFTAKCVVRCGGQWSLALANGTRDQINEQRDHSKWAAHLAFHVPNELIWPLSLEVK